MPIIEKVEDDTVVILKAETFNLFAEAINEWRNLITGEGLELVKGEAQSILSLGDGKNGETASDSSERPFRLSFIEDLLFVNPGAVHSIIPTLNGLPNTGLEENRPFIAISESGFIWLRVAFGGNAEPYGPIAADVIFSTDAAKADSDDEAWQLIGSVQFANGRIRKVNCFVLNSLDVCRQKNSTSSTYLFGSV